MTTAEADVRTHRDGPAVDPAPTRRRLTMNDELLGFRTISLLPAVIFVPTILGEVLLPGTAVGPIFGIVFHLAALFWVSRVPVPSWAKAAGFGWIAIDVAVGVMDINLVPEHIYMPLRLGGHVLAMTWIITVSLLSRGTAFRVVGLVTAVLLGGYSFVGTIVPVDFLTVPSLGTVIWFVIAAVQGEPDPLGGVRRRARRTAVATATTGSAASDPV